MEDETKKQTSPQVNVRMPPDWLAVLKELADFVSQTSGKPCSVKDLIRECIRFAFEWVEKRHRQEPGWKYQLVHKIRQGGL